jgi:hypothetical protein
VIDAKNDLHQNLPKPGVKPGICHAEISSHMNSGLLCNQGLKLRRLFISKNVVSKALGKWRFNKHLSAVKYPSQTSKMTKRPDTSILLVRQKVFRSVDVFSDCSSNL